MKKLRLKHILWSLYLIVASLVIYVWGRTIHWSLLNLNPYNTFPLFGLLAFSIMWVHYISGFIRDKFFPEQSTKISFKITSYFVLVLIILHPALLLAKLFFDGYGLPPGSYEAYVGRSNAIWVLLGTLGLSGFLLFETKRWFGKKSWWKYISVINDIAIMLISLHSLMLGRNLRSGWFVYVWYFYISTILVCIFRNYYNKLSSKVK